MKRIGLTLISLAFLGGAYLAVLDPETLDWTAFGAIVLFGFVGTVLVARARRDHHGSEEAVRQNTERLRQRIGAIVTAVEKLGQEFRPESVYDLPRAIDSRVLEHLNDFVANRETMKVAYGLQGFAAVMGPYAGGERYLNRVWSAAADGYADEAGTYLGRALEQFRIAEEKLAECEALAQ